MTLLAAEALGLEHGDALEADLVEGVFDLVEFEGLDDRFDLLHLLKTLRMQAHQRRRQKTARTALGSKFDASNFHKYEDGNLRSGALCLGGLDSN